ncbi:MAG: thiosulfate oxidation carrier complex protein SoxZ [Methylophaga sp.]|nr:MAG: thiosulfate oxidation carrier complex protein SoxZ [Methylophaga sp.]
MKVKAKMKKGLVVVKVLAKHPMETGMRKDKKTDELIPAKYIQELICKHQDKVVFEANFGRAISKNPYVAFSFKGGQSGDTLSLTWVDNTGETKAVEAVIK